MPSISTVHAPQEESSQPRFDPVSCSSVRSTSSSSSLGSMASSYPRPFTRSSMSSFFMIQSVTAPPLLGPRILGRESGTLEVISLTSSIVRPSLSRSCRKVFLSREPVTAHAVQELFRETEIVTLNRNMLVVSRAQPHSVLCVLRVLCGSILSSLCELRVLCRETVAQYP